MPKQMTATTFAQRATEIHGDKFNYSLVEYINSRTPVKIICPQHGVIEQLPRRHLHSKFGCKPCAINTRFSYKRLTQVEFIERATRVHGDQYDYSLAVYTHGKALVDIICQIHGAFHQQAGTHIYYGSGCPECAGRLSKGEERIREFLDSCHIQYTRFKRFKKCRGKGVPLEFDFYLPECHILIEYDGVQHFKPIDWFGGIKTFERQQKRDAIKNDFAKNSKYTLIRVPYTEFNNIEEILLANLNLMER